MYMYTEDLKVLALPFLFTGLLASVQPGALAAAEVHAVSSPDPFSVQEWAAAFFFSEQGILLDEDIQIDDVESVALRSIQVGYSEVHETNTVVLLWRESSADAAEPVSISLDGQSLGTVASLEPAARPGFNFAVVTDLAANPAGEPAYEFGASRGEETIGAATQSVVSSFPMGTEFTPECNQISPRGGVCLLEICWTNPGPPTSGFELSVGGTFVLYREENAPGELNREEVSIPFQSDYAVRVTSMIVAEDPDVTPFAFDPAGDFFTPSGSFRGDAREILCPVTCGPPPPARFVRGLCGGEGESPEIADVVASLDYLFLGNETPPCLAACDSNADGVVDVGDPVHTLFYLLAGGPPPPGWIDQTGNGSPDPTCQIAATGESCEHGSSVCQ